MSQEKDLAKDKLKTHLSCLFYHFKGFLLKKKIFLWGLNQIIIQPPGSHAFLWAWHDL